MHNSQYRFPYLSFSGILVLLSNHYADGKLTDLPQVTQLLRCLSPKVTGMKHVLSWALNIRPQRGMPFLCCCFKPEVQDTWRSKNPVEILKVFRGRGQVEVRKGLVLEGRYNKSRRP